MKVTVMSRLEAISHSTKSNINKCVIVSINSLNSNKTWFHDNEQILDIYPLFFNDIERDYEDSLAPVEKDFIGLKDFIDTYKDMVDEIIVHCAAGISRSSAVAAAICKYLNLNELETIWKQHCYIPNALVYKLTKKELDLEWNEEEFTLFLATNKAERDKIDIPINIIIK